jgi:GT2 family glycosyltransferase/MoaA/NifB/PqqE/SkfB family radical SAM enzyme
MAHSPSKKSPGSAASAKRAALPHPFVSVVTVNYNGRAFLCDCIDSLYAQQYPKNRLEIVVVDNASTDDSIEQLKARHPGVTVILRQENHYCNAVNQGIVQSTGNLVAVVNNDTKMDENWLAPLVEVMQSHPDAGAVGSKILFEDGRIQSVGHIRYPGHYWVDRGFGEQDRGQYDGLFETESLCGASMLLRKEALDNTGLFDEDFEMYLEDVDMGLRMTQKGWRLYTISDSVLVHKNHGTIGSEEKAMERMEKNRLLLLAKHWPDELCAHLSGHGYFVDKHTVNPLLFRKALFKAYQKLAKEHPPDTAARVMEQITWKLEELFIPERDALIKRLADQENALLRLEKLEFAAKENEIRKEREAHLRMEIAKHKKLLRSREEQIARLENSRGMRYIVRPLESVFVPVERTIKGLVMQVLPAGRELAANQPLSTQAPEHPVNITIKCTDQCHLKCAMCDIWKAPRVAELSTGQWKQIVSEFCDWLGPFTLNIAGGEPLLREDVEDLAALCSQNSVDVTLITNGALITPKRAKNLIEAGIRRFNISVDSLDASVHDKLRGVDGTHAKVMAGIDHLRSAALEKGVPIHICLAAVVMNPTLDGLLRLTDFVDRGGADSIIFQALEQNFHAMPDSSWRNESPLWVKDLSLLNRVMDELAAKKSEGYAIVNPLRQLEAIREYFSDPKVWTARTVCQSGNKNFIVTINGDALLCWNFPPVGNLIQERPENLWNNDKAIALRRQIAQCQCTCKILNCHFA